MINFEEVSLSDIQALVPDIQESWFQENEDFYSGDHWQNGDGWIGPKLSTSGSTAAQMLSQIHEVFISKNVIREVIDRHVAGVLSDDPVWTIEKETLEGEESEETGEIGPETVVTPAEEADDVLRRWWASQQCQIEAEERLADPKSAIAKALVNALRCGRGPLRLFLPAYVLQKRLDEEGREVYELPQVTNILEAVQKIYLHVPDPEFATVNVDDETLRPYGVYLYSEGEDLKEIQLVPSTEAKSEVTFIDDDLFTWVAIRGSEMEFEDSAVLDLGGQLMMHEISVPVLIDESVRTNQKLLNMALTMMGRNVVQGGFLERVIMNAQLPGKEVLNERTGEFEFYPEPLDIGAGKTSFIAGIEYEDADGNVHVLNPSISYRDPVSIDTFVNTQMSAYRNILEGANQAHVLMASEAGPSGESRRQARADFEQSLRVSQSQIDTALDWLFRTVLKLVGVLSGQPTRYDTVNISVSTFLNTGPLSTEEETSLINQVSAGLLSKRTARMMLGIQDPEAEADLIHDEKMEAASLQNMNLAQSFMNVQGRLSRGELGGVENPTREVTPEAEEEE